MVTAVHRAGSLSSSGKHLLLLGKTLTGYYTGLAPREGKKGQVLKEADDGGGTAVILRQGCEAPLLFHCFGLGPVVPPHVRIEEEIQQ